MHDLVIVGGGPAAFAAASYALNKQLDALLIYEQLGGKVGQIVVNSHNATSTGGVYAAGDVTTTGDEHVLAAIGDGGRAAKSAYMYLLTQRLVAGASPAASS